MKSCYLSDEKSVQHYKWICQLDNQQLQVLCLITKNICYSFLFFSKYDWYLCFSSSPEGLEASSQLLKWPLLTISVPRFWLKNPMNWPLNCKGVLFWRHQVNKSINPFSTGQYSHLNPLRSGFCVQWECAFTPGSIDSASRCWSLAPRLGSDVKT